MGCLSDSPEGIDVVGSSKADWGGAIALGHRGLMMLPWLSTGGEPIVYSHAAPYVALLAAGGAVVTLVGIVLTILAKRDVDRVSSSNIPIPDHDPATASESITIPPSPPEKKGLSDRMIFTVVVVVQ